MRLLLAAATVAACLAVACSGGSSSSGPPAASKALLAVVTTGQGGGTVTGPGIACASGSAEGCSTQLDVTHPPQAVTLHATPDGHSYFLGWSGPCSGTADCTLSIASDTTAIAAFEPAFTVTVQVAGAGGAVTGPGGFECAAGSCRLAVPISFPLPQVALSADPAVTFVAWSGACAGMGTACTLTVDGDAEVTATFFGQVAGGRDVGPHFDAAGAAWAAPLSGACVRCHTGDGFLDYVGYDGTPNVADRTFLSDATSGTIQPLRCVTCHNPASDPLAGALTVVVFPSLGAVADLDGGTAVCSQCHQGRESTASVATRITANVSAAARGLGVVSTSANAAGTATTLVRSGFVADQYKGYAMLFTNGANKGTWVSVTGNDSTTITFTPAVAVATKSGDTVTLRPAATGGDVDSAFTAKGVTMPAVDRGVSLVDANRTWTANQWQSYYLYVLTGANAGLYRAITGNTATTLAVASASLTSGMPFPSPISAGDLYLILPPEDTTGAGELDKVSSSLSFLNVHDAPASATLHGAEARGAFQHPLNWASGSARVAAATSYSGKNLHGVTQDRCASCHDAHSGAVIVGAATCGRCHAGDAGAPVASLAELEASRQQGFDGDVDGDGAQASVRAEIDGLAALLLQAIRNYGNLSLGGATHPICHAAGVSPYFFKDQGLGGGIAGNGICEPGETTSSNAYGASGAGWFTPRLLRAAYDYQYYALERGAWAHNPRYAVQFLYDAVKDLNQLLPPSLTPAAGGQVGYVCSSDTGRVDMNADGSCPAGYTRTFAAQRGFGSGHFAASANAFRWRDTTVNTAGMVGYPCQQCHAGEKGLEAFLGVATWFDETAGYAAAVPPVQGMECTTCHQPLAGDADMKRLRDVGGTVTGGVRFPSYLASGTILSAGYTTVLSPSAFGSPADMLCSTCHSGRDLNGLALEKYLDGTWSGFDVPGSRFVGAGSISNNGSGNVRLAGLPLYQAPAPKGTPNNWLYSTSCLAVGRYVTLSGSAQYGGTYPITACGDGYADLAVAWSGDEPSVSWSAWTAAAKTTHDLQGAARVYGGDAHVGYEYGGKVYAGRKRHHGVTASCVECHSPTASRHTMRTADVVAVGACATCHVGADYGTWSSAARALTTGPGYDGDPTTQTLPDELASFRHGLAAAMNAYQRAAGVVQAGGNLCWSDAAGAFRTELGNTTGRCVSSTTNWTTWDARLSRASWNLFFASTRANADRGAPFHNFDYAAQLLYDSAQDLNGGAPVTYPSGANTFTLTRP